MPYHYFYQVIHYLLHLLKYELSHLLLKHQLLYHPLLLCYSCHQHPGLTTHYSVATSIMVFICISYNLFLLLKGIYLDGLVMNKN